MEKINEMYIKLISKSEYENQIMDFIESEDKYDDWLLNLYKLEKTIGGVGIHNVNIAKFSPGGYWYTTGTYMEDRPIFRAIQYCARSFIENFIELDGRYLSWMSGSHIEGILKKIVMELEGLDNVGLPIGGVIDKYLKKSEYFKDPEQKELIELIKIINNVYCKAKHDYNTDWAGDSNFDIDSHLLEYKDSVIMYFSCRILGMNLMSWMKSKDIAPIAFTQVPMISYDEFLEAGDIWIKNCKASNPYLAKLGKNWMIIEDKLPFDI